MSSSWEERDKSYDEFWQLVGKGSKIITLVLAVPFFIVLGIPWFIGKIAQIVEARLKHE